MLRAIQYLAALLVVGFGLWIFGTSSSFQTCTTEQAAANAEQGQKNLPPLVLAGANRAAIYARCGGHVIYEYRDFATAGGADQYAAQLPLFQSTVDRRELGV